VAIANEQRKENTSDNEANDERELMALREKGQNRQEWQPRTKQNEQQRRAVDRKRIGDKFQAASRSG